MEQEYRCYTFSHFMLSPMAKGIQTLHSTVEMFNKYQNESEQKRMLFEWSQSHKTVISLNAGVSGDLDRLFGFLNLKENEFPWCQFNEDEYSLKGVMTAISIVLPEKIYTTALILRTNKDIEFSRLLNGTNKLAYDGTKSDIIETFKFFTFTDFEVELIKLLNVYRLAN